MASIIKTRKVSTTKVDRRFHYYNLPSEYRDNYHFTYMASIHDPQHMLPHELLPQHAAIFLPKDRTDCIVNEDQILFKQYLAFKVDKLQTQVDYTPRLVLRNKSLKEAHCAALMLFKDDMILDMAYHNNLPTIKDDQMLKNVYRIRQLLGIHEDFGYKTQLENTVLEFNIQSDSKDTKSFFADMVVPNDIGKDEKNEKSLINNVLTKFINFFTFGTGKISSILGKIRDKIVNYIWNLLFSFTSLATAIKQMVMKTMIIIAIAGFMVVSGIISYKFISTMLSFMTGKTVNNININVNPAIEKVQMQVDSTSTELGLLIAAASFAFGSIGALDLQRLTTNLTKYVKIAAGGALVAATGRILFFALPKVFTEYFIYKFAPQTIQDNYDFGKWMDEATMLIKCGQTASIVVSKVYFDRIVSCEKLGEEFLKKPVKAETRTQLVNIYSQILKIYGEIYPFHVASGTRRVPFALHVAGEPGVGKSLLQNDIQKALHFTNAQVYNRQAGQQFWSGYNSNHTMVVFDEFLATADGEVMAADILSLISPATFKPDMASLNSPAVGIKGTKAEPDFVMTINNSLYKTVLGVSRDALQRRRNMNVLFSVNSSGRHYMVDGHLDIPAMPSEYYLKRGWITVTLHPAMESSTALTPIKTWTFEQFLEQLRIKYDKHQLSCDLIAEGRNDIKQLDPEMLMNEVLGDIQKTEPFTFSWDTVGSLASQLFGLQGNNRKKKKTQSIKRISISSNSSQEYNTCPSAAASCIPDSYGSARSSCDFESTSPKSTASIDTETPFGYPEQTFKEFVNSMEVNLPNQYDVPDDKQMELSLRPGSTETIIRGSNVCDEIRLIRNWGFERSDLGQNKLIEAAETILFDGLQDTKMYENALCVCGTIVPRQEEGTQCENCLYELHVPDLFGKVKHLIKYTSPIRRKMQTNQYIKDNQVDYSKVAEFLDIEDNRELVLEGTRSLSTIFMDWFKENFSCMVKAFSIITGLGALIYLFKKTFGETTDCSEEEDFYNVNSNVKKDRSNGTSSRKYNARRYDLQANSIENNLINMTLSTPTTTSTMYGIGLIGNKILTNYHFFIQKGKLVENGANLSFDYNGRTVKFVFDRFFLVTDPEADLAIYECFNTEVPVQFKDITKNIISDDIFSRYSGGSCMLLAKDRQDYTRVSKHGHIKYGDAYQNYHHNESLIYPISTEVGDCGRPLISISGPSAGKIIGLHVGHANGTGVSTILTKSFIETALKEVKTEDSTIVELTMQSEEHEVTEKERQEIAKQTSSHKDFLCNIYGYAKQKFKKISREDMIMHDASKYEETEVLGYIDKFIRGKDTERWNVALQHHYNNNKHHPEHFIVNGVKQNMTSEALHESIIDMMASKWQKEFKGSNTQISELCKIDPQFLKRYTEHDRKLVQEKLSGMKELDREIEFVPGLCEDWKIDRRLDLEEIALLPNCKNIEIVPKEERVHIADQSSIVKSSIDLGHVSNRHFPILSRDDPRSHGKSPVDEGVRRILSSKVTPIPEDEGIVVYQQMKEYYTTKFAEAKRETGIWRKLTMEEAIRGIPGYLKSINLSTSTGWPHVLTKKKQGKHDYLYVENGEIKWTNEFEYRVRRRYEEMQSGKSDEETLWLGFMKDELVSKNKIDEVRTRIVYCGDVVNNVVNRMVFGSILVNYHALGFGTPVSSMMNQYSSDMDGIKCYLDEIESPGYIAGDAKNFDINYNPTAQKYVYKVIADLAMTIPDVTEGEIQFCIDREMNTRVQIGQYRFKPKCLHSSGCFFTSSVNSWVHEFYWRVVFNRKFPNLRFEDEVRAKFCGDDNIVRPSAKIWDDYNAVEYAKESAKFGQHYTSDVKDAELDASPRRFEDITFLGAHPRYTSTGEGFSWTGALKKNTILDALTFKKSSGYEEKEVAKQLLENASQWDKPYYEDLKVKIVASFAKQGVTFETIDYETAHRIIKSRTAASKTDYSFFFNIQSDSRDLTALVTEEGSEVAIVPESGGDPDKGFQDQPMDMTFTQKSNVIRHQYEWKEGDAIGTIIAAIPIPFGLLSLGNNQSMQNRPFQQFQYWKGNTKVTIQVNGNRFQQGMLAVYFIPLWNHTKRSRDIDQIPTFRPVYIQPSNTQDTEMEIPFRFIRNMLNTRAAGEVDESLGIMFISVFSKLLNLNNNSLTVTVLSAFPESEFRIPGVIKPVAFECLKAGELSGQPGYRHVVDQEGQFHMTSDSDVSALLEKDPDFFNIQGNTTSNSSVSYNVSEVSGTMAVENAGPRTKGGVKASAKVDVTPMDNPMLSSGGIPTFPQFSGMSVVEGIEPTTSMQMHPRALTRTEPYHFGKDYGDQTFESLCGRDNVVKRLIWNTSQINSFALFDTSLTMPLCVDIETSKGTFEDLKPSIFDFVSDHFTFWRADFVFTVMAVKTLFHTGRLQFSMTYGGTQRASFTDATNSYSEIIDFKDNEVGKFTVPYNAATEFLQTYEPSPMAPNVFQDYTLGHIQLDVLNRLTCPDTVEQEIELIILCHLENVKFHCPRKFGMVAVCLPTEDSFNIQSNEESVAETVDGNLSESSFAIGHTDPPISNPPCSLKISDHFEYCPSSVIEYIRRPKQVDIDFLPISAALEEGGVHTTPGCLQYKVIGFYGLSQLFAGVRGGQKLRIFTGSKQTQAIIYVPDGRNKRFSHDPHVLTEEYRTGPPICDQIVQDMNRFETCHAKGGDVRLQGDLFVDLTNQGLNLNLGQQEHIEIKTSLIHGKYGRATNDAGAFFSANGTFAEEMLIPVGDNNYIDVYIPYQNIKNFLKTSEQIWGTVSIMKDNKNNDYSDNRIFVSAADDMQLGLYHGIDLKLVTYGSVSEGSENKSVSGCDSFGFSGFVYPHLGTVKSLVHRLGGARPGKPTYFQAILEI